MDPLEMEEFEAWQKIVKEWNKRIGDMNQPQFDHLTKLINIWGEWLAKLRISQGPEGLKHGTNRILELK